ncbi:hypothetical protein CDL12_07556 [Handroanthus impetiginosus]|uniref:Uncharacterized protein n=1 Tax=Handroanthus impetiginosus TaxID=429701 RepID=A0A2G9HQG8_9LAMI|nr:hypothetical protein CDL12_07556 [Handroanthus impetiginosus]
MVLSAEMKYLAAKGKFMELTERSLRIAAKLAVLNNSSNSISEGRHRFPPGVDDDDFSHVLEFELAFMFAKMRGMTPQEAQAFAAQEVAEAEAAMAKAEKAVREAEAAEAEAEAAEAFAMAATRSLKRRKIHG